MKILFISYSDINSGNATRILNLAKYVSKKFDVDIIFDGSKSNNFPNSFKDLNIKFTPYLKNIYLTLAFGIIYKTLYGLFKNYEIVHVFKPLPTSFIPAYIISKMHRLKLFLDFDDWEKSGGLGFRMPFLSQFIDFSIKKSDYVIAVTKFLKNEALKLNKKVVFIPNGANVDFFKLIKSRNKNTIIFIGILFKTCDVDMVIRAMKYVKNGKLIVVGDGPRRREFEDLTQSIGVSDKVEFVGWIDRGKIPEYINSADIAVMPMKVNLINKSRSPVKFGEYMACFPEGQEVFDANLEPIQNLTSNHSILNGGNILKTYEREYVGELVKIKPKGLPEVKVTLEHPILVRESEMKYDGELKKQGRYNYRKVLKKLVWKKASELKLTDYLTLPKKIVTREISKLPENKTFAYFLGQYLGDGWVEKSNKTYRINLAYGNKQDLENKYKAIKLIGFEPYNQIKTRKILFHNKNLGKLLLSLGHGCENKHLLPEIFSWSNDSKLELIRGLLDSDGYISKSNQVFYSTVSKTLVYDLYVLLGTIGIRGNIYSYHDTKSHLIEGRQIKSFRRKWVLFIAGYRQLKILGIEGKKEREHFNSYHSDDEYTYIPMERLGTEKYIGKVYNLKTETGTYMVPFIVHNCGKAIIASDVGIAKDIIINRENGILVSDIKQFGDAINLLLKNKKLRHKLEKNARKTAEKALDWKIIAGNLINAYETVK